MNKEEEENFLKEINSVPMWVKTEEDLFKFARHINYRFLQNKVELQRVNKILDKYLSQKILEDEYANSKWSEYDRAYGNQEDFVYVPLSEYRKLKNEIKDESEDELAFSGFCP
jgi:hypothetical protein